MDGEPIGESIYRQDPDTDGNEEWYTHTNADLGDAAGTTWETLEEAMTAIGNALAPRAGAAAQSRPRA